MLRMKSLCETYNRSARRRIKACDETIAGLREAKQLTAEAEREMRAAERAAKAAQKTPPAKAPTKAGGD